MKAIDYLDILINVRKHTCMTVAVLLFRIVAFVPYCSCTSCGAFVTSLRCILLPSSTIQNVIFNMQQRNILTFFHIFMTFLIYYFTYKYLKSIVICCAIDLLHIYLWVTAVLLLTFLFFLWIVNHQHLSPVYMYEFINKMCT